MASLLKLLSVLRPACSSLLKEGDRASFGSAAHINTASVVTVLVILVYTIRPAPPKKCVNYNALTVVADRSIFTLFGA